MTGRKRIVVQVAVDHGRAEPLGQCNALGNGVSINDTAAGYDDRKLGAGEQVGRFGKCLLAAGSAVEKCRLRYVDINLAIEQVARNIELCGTHF